VTLRRNSESRRTQCHARSEGWGGGEGEAGEEAEEEKEEEEKTRFRTLSSPPF